MLETYISDMCSLDVPVLYLDILSNWKSFWYFHNESVNVTDPGSGINDSLTDKNLVQISYQIN